MMPTTESREEGGGGQQHGAQRLTTPAAPRAGFIGVCRRRGEGGCGGPAIDLLVILGQVGAELEHGAHCHVRLAQAAQPVPALP